MFDEIETILTEAIKLQNDKTLTNEQKQSEAEGFAKKEFERWQDNLSLAHKLNPILFWSIQTFGIPVLIKFGVWFLKKEGIIK